MGTVLNEIAKIFVNVAIDEDKTLRELCGEGIFFMPEIAYAYACGKNIMKKRNELFQPGQDVKWQRECKPFESYGLCDLIIMLPPDKRIAVEFKMRSQLSAYTADIDKLQRLNNDDPSTACIFCVLLDPFTKNLPDDGCICNDGRICNIENNSTSLCRLMDTFHGFETRQNWYSTPISCVVAAWSVGVVPNWIHEIGKRES